MDMKYNFIKKIKDGKFSLGEDLRQTGRDISKFFEGIKAYKDEIFLTAAGVVCLGCLYKIIEYNTYPRYVDVSTYEDASYVSFRDDMAPGMRAFIEYERLKDGMPLKMKQEMPNFIKQERLCTFTIPQPALRAREFVVSAVNRGGNESKPKKLYVLEGIVVEKNPN